MGHDGFDPNGPVLLETRGLSKIFPSSGIFSRRPALRAVDGVDLVIRAGRTLALVGETGSGKSTLARCIVRLEEPTSGEIWVAGTDFTALSGKALRQFRPQIQLIFQEAMSALNPRFTAAEIIAEPLLLASTMDSAAALRRALDLLDAVGLSRDAAQKFPQQFSGGQKQRLALARALAAEPRVLILDESLSGLDLSVQGQMVNLLFDLQETQGLAYLFITHDLSLARSLADEVAIMKDGAIVERNEAMQLFDRPQHPYTQSLVAAMQQVSGTPNGSEVLA